MDKGNFSLLLSLTYKILKKFKIFIKIYKIIHESIILYKDRFFFEGLRNY